MSYILNIETSTNVCSVAITSGSRVVFEQEESKGPSHATLLGVFANNAMDFVRKEGLKLDAVAVSCGPGSYTGLRIGVSEAKGLCYGMDIPLIAINSPLIMASKIADSKKYPADMLLCPMIDARRMEVYAAIYDSQLNVIRDIQADIVNENSYREFLESHKVAFFGNGAEKCKEYLNHPNAAFIEDIYPLAANMASLANDEYNNNRFVDVAYFEPFYLKEFVATTPKNKVL